MGREIDVPDLSPTPRREAMEANEYWERKNNRRLHIKIEKAKKRTKRIEATLVLTALMLISGLSKFGNEQFKGEKYIMDNYAATDDAYDKFGILDLSNGLSVTRTSKSTGRTEYVSLDEAVDYVINRGRNEGFSDSECYIIVENEFNKTVAKQYLPDVTASDVREAKEIAYHESEIAEKGVSK